MEHKQRQISGPPWAAKAAECWLAGEREVDLAERFGVTRQRVSQVMIANGLRRPWVAISKLAKIASLWHINRWVAAGRVRQLSNGLVHEGDVMRRVKVLRMRWCNGPECTEIVDDLGEDVTLCPRCRALKAEYDYPFLDERQRQRRLERMRVYRSKRGRVAQGQTQVS